MIHVTAGTDVYGAVRSVNGTPIVTKFAMLQFFPLYPVQSFYLRRLGRRSRTGVPLIAGTETRDIVGIPCNRINFLSALVAYLRAIGATLVLFAAMGIFIFTIGALCDRTVRLSDGGGRTAALILGTGLAAGLAIALPTYLFTKIVPARDRRVRQACASFLGIAADPAHVALEAAKEIIAAAERFMQGYGTPSLDAILSGSDKHRTDDLTVWLSLVRVQVQVGGKSSDYERITDQILDALDAIARTRGAS